MYIRVITALLALFFSSASISAADDVVVASPDGRIQFRLSLGDQGRLQ